jgi:hypothetical protein
MGTYRPRFVSVQDYFLVAFVTVLGSPSLSLPASIFGKIMNFLNRTRHMILLYCSGGLWKCIYHSYVS